MAILATERWSDRAFRVGYPINAWHGRRGFDVTGAANEDDARLAVEGQYGVTIGSAHPLNQLFKANMPDAKEISPTLFRVTVDYTVPPTGFIPNELDPLQYPPEIEAFPGSHSGPAAIDGEGNPIVNAAGDYFDPSPNIERPCLTIQVFRYEPAWDLNVLKKSGKINSDSFTIKSSGAQSIQVSPYQLRLNSYRPTNKYFLESPFVPVMYELELRPDVSIVGDGWDLVTPNVGFRGWYQGPNGPTIGGLYDATGQPISQPVDLDANGIPLDPSITVGPQRAAPIANPNGGLSPDMIERADSGAILIHYFPYKSIPLGNLL